MHFSDRGNQWAAAPTASALNPYGLSAREFDVARLLGRGLGLAEVAETLGLSGRRVLAERERLMQKLRARNLAHLEHIIATLGQLDTDWSGTVYLDDLSDGLTADAESDLVFAD